MTFYYRFPRPPFCVKFGNGWLPFRFFPRYFKCTVTRLPSSVGASSCKKKTEQSRRRRGYDALKRQQPINRNRERKHLTYVQQPLKNRKKGFHAHALFCRLSFSYLSLSLALIHPSLDPSIHRSRKAPASQASQYQTLTLWRPSVL